MILRCGSTGSRLADFAAIVLLSPFFSSQGSTGSRLVLLAAFAALVLATAVAVMTAGRSRRLGSVLVRLQDTTAEIRVRARWCCSSRSSRRPNGLVSRASWARSSPAPSSGPVDRDSTTHPHFRIKLEAIGFGFLVPVFFVGSGIGLDLTGLFANPSALVRVPRFLLALLLVRGLPAPLGLRSLGLRPTLGVALLQATSLPFLVTSAQIGMSLGMLDTLTGAALICAGLLSVLLFPLLALAQLRASAPEPVSPSRR